MYPASAAARAEALLDMGGKLAALVDDLPALRHAVTRTVAELCGDTAVLWEVRPSAGDRELVLTSSWHERPEARADLHSLGAPVRLPESGQSFLWQVVAGPPLLLPRVGADDLEAVAPAYREYFGRWGLTSMIIVPLRARDDLLGVLGVSRDENSERFDDDDLAFVRRVAGMVALALDNAVLLATVRAELAERARTHSALQHMARHDPLTGLPNRAYLMTSLERAVASGPVALLLLDLTGFKQINDSLGHHLGDYVLMDTASVLAGALPSPLQLFRLGGDEFAVLVPEVQAGGAAVEAVAAEVADRLAAALSEPRTIAGVRLHLGAGIGIASHEADIEGVDAAVSLLKRADLAMYRAKTLKPSVATWDPELDSAAEVRLRDIVELREAISGGQLRMHYQPVVRSGDLSVHHVEALVRWEHPTRGLLSAAEFVPLAEQAGLCVELATATIPGVLDQLVSWRQSGGPTRVALNVPAPVLVHDDFGPGLLQALARRGLPEEALLLELTESGLAEASAVDVVTELADAGVRWAVDDFGTGWSSLARLRDLPLHELKIDRAFVAELETDPVAQSIVRSVVDLAHALNLVTVAEGVETDEVSRLLTRFGVDYQQGWLHGRPAPA